MPAERLRSFEAVEALATPGTHALVLASGSLASAYLVRRMAARFPGAVTVLHVGLGVDAGAPEPLPALCQALSVELQSLDASADFAERFVVPAIRAQARFQGTSPLSHSLWQALVAEKAAGIARERHLRLVVHAAAAGRHSLDRLNTALVELGFTGAYGSPFEAKPVPPEEKLRALQELGIGPSPSWQPRVRENLWSRTLEAGEPGASGGQGWKDGAFTWTKATREQPMRVLIGFERGTPKLLDGCPLGLKELLSTLNREVGAYGLGRFLHLDTSEEVRVDQVHEAPGAALLLDAYKRLETECLPAELLREKQRLEQLWTREAVAGRWFGLPRRAAESFVATLAESVTGEVEYELSRGGPRPLRIQPKKQ